MIRRWGHLHTLASGVAGGLLLDRHLWLVALLCFGGGLTLGRLWGGLVMVESLLRQKLLYAKRDRGLSKPRLVTPLVDRDEIPY